MASLLCWSVRAVEEVPQASNFIDCFSIHANTLRLNLAQLSGLTLGLSVAGAVFLNLAQNDLTTLLPNVGQEEVQQLISGTSSSLFTSLPADIRAQALAIIVNSLRTT